MLSNAREQHSSTCRKPKIREIRLQYFRNAVCYHPYLKEGMSIRLEQLKGATKATYNTVYLFTTH